MVGLSTTVAPFDKVHSVTPASGRAVVFTTVPRTGFVAISACPAAASMKAVSRFADAALTTVANCA